jgi:hypothetical protein
MHAIALLPTRPSSCAWLHGLLASVCVRPGCAAHSAECGVWCMVHGLIVRMPLATCS